LQFSIFNRPLKSLLFLGLLFLSALPSLAQEPRFTFAVRGAPLDEVLERFVTSTGLAVSYDPGLVRGRLAYCAAENQPAETVLRCILSTSDLDFYRLSSGTYVLIPRAEVSPQRGTVYGTVIDLDTGSPIPNAHVYLADAGIGTVSNVSGQFVLPQLLPGRYPLIISHVGYQPWQDTLSVTPLNRTRTEAGLRPDPIFITPVVIDGLQQLNARGSGAVDLADSPEALAAVPGAGAFRSLSQLPGVRIHDFAADVYVQGGDAGEHQLRLDGVPVYLPRTMPGLAGPFSAFAIDRITVQKAGFGAVHGSQTSGVVDARHSVGTARRMNVQVDPLSVNARAEYRTAAGPATEIASMAAVRLGLWDVYRPARLQSMLSDWSTPDLFLIAAPFQSSTSISASPPVLRAFSPTSNASSILSSAQPALQFTDVHTATRIRFGPMRTLQATLYRGTSSLSGDRLRGTVTPQSSSALLTVRDEYEWRNTLAQIRYQAVLGSRTLIGARLYGSSYRLDHAFEVLDSLYLGGSQARPQIIGVSTRPLSDGNRVQTFAIETTADHAAGRHHLRLGSEVALNRSRFDLYSVHFRSYSASIPEDRATFDLWQGDPSEAAWSATDAWHFAGFAEDVFTISSRFRLEAGVRVTYLPVRQSVYGEPRLALRYDSERGLLSSRTAAGIYRQYVSQMDVSRLNPGSLLPSVRIWFPADGSVRPPSAYHLTQEFVFRPARAWSVQAEAYYKHHPYGLTVGYAPAPAQRLTGGFLPQRQFLISTQGRSYGTALSIERTGSSSRTQVLYAFSDATRRSPSLFGGRETAVPWNEPHRLVLAFDWMPNSNITASARWQGVWGRAWGFRMAYYDYFGQYRALSTYGGFDLSDPSSHVLPPLYQLDVSLAYARPIGTAGIQLRLDALNLLDRQNVADWRLVPSEQGYHREPRHLYPFMPAGAIRVTW
jgi:hypothetical protein